MKPVKVTTEVTKDECSVTVHFEDGTQLTRRTSVITSNPISKDEPDWWIYLYHKYCMSAKDDVLYHVEDLCDFLDAVEEDNLSISGCLDNIEYELNESENEG